VVREMAPEELDSFLSSRFFAACEMGSRFRSEIEDVGRWLELSARYESWLDRKDTPKTAIPKTVHQIWIGGELPAKYEGFARSWVALNPDFEYRLWNEAAIANMLDERVAGIFEKTVNFGAKSDIARYAILEKFGGVYADTDFECLKPIGPLAERTSFFAGVTVDTSPQIMNSIMGASAGHPFLRALLESLEEPLRSDKGRDVLHSTGPFFLSREFFECRAASGDFDIVLPTKVFYPFPSQARYRRYESSEEIKRRYHREEALAIHYWEVSWQDKETNLIVAAKRFVKRVIFWKRLEPILRRSLRRRR